MHGFDSRRRLQDEMSVSVLGKRTHEWLRERFPYALIVRMRKRSWTKTQLKEAVEKSFSYRQVLIKLGLREAGGNYYQLKKYLTHYKFDTSHFRGYAWNKGFKIPREAVIPLEAILVKQSSFQTFKLKKRLFAVGLKAQNCEECGWAKKTEDGYLPLELDHINGDHSDHRLENLRVLCPNCHSLKPTYRGRKNKGKHKARVAK